MPRVHLVTTAIRDSKARLALMFALSAGLDAAALRAYLARFGG
ncbi:hypothetical protein WMF18_15915 [Sorangium sp. So ce315]